MVKRTVSLASAPSRSSINVSVTFVAMRSPLSSRRVCPTPADSSARSADRRGDKCHPRARLTCRSALMSGVRRSSFCHVVRRPSESGQRRPQHCLSSAVLIALQSGQATTVRSSCCTENNSSGSGRAECPRPVPALSTPSYRSSRQRPRSGSPCLRPATQLKLCKSVRSPPLRAT